MEGPHGFSPLGLSLPGAGKGCQFNFGKVFGNSWRVLEDDWNERGFYENTTYYASVRYRYGLCGLHLDVGEQRPLGLEMCPRREDLPNGKGGMLDPSLPDEERHYLIDALDVGIT